MTKINSNPNVASILAQNLDAKDGKQDGKINANVWNEFVQGKGGKTIKYSITVENAMKSISTYLAKNSHSTERSKEDLFTEWFTQDLSVDKARKQKLATSMREKEVNNMKKDALKPEAIEQAANAIVDFITGKTEQYFVNPNNAAQVFLKASEKFEGGKLPKTNGTAFYLLQLFPTLVRKAKELGIRTDYTENQRFGDNYIDKKLAACRDLAYQISEKEKGLPQNKVI